MKTIPIGKLKNMNTEEIKQAVPFLVTSADEPLFFMGDALTTIDLSNLHPAMQTKLRNLYRIGCQYVRPEQES